MSDILGDTITSLQSWPGELHTLGLFMLCVATILLFWRCFGLWGLIVYTCLAGIAANIQVLKLGEFSWISEPVAGGTVVFTSIFLVSDMVTEFYGAATARKVVHLSLSSMILMTVWMILTVAHPSALTPATLPRAQQIQDALSLLFIPAPALTAASLIAYAVSLHTDIWIFNTIRRLTKEQMLWLRTGLSTLTSGFVDTVIFSVLAWVVFAPCPMDTGTLIKTYILGSYGLRMLLCCSTAPCMYLARRLHSISL